MLAVVVRRRYSHCIEARRCAVGCRSIPGAGNGAGLSTSPVDDASSASGIALAILILGVSLVSSSSGELVAITVIL